MKQLISNIPMSSGGFRGHHNDECYYGRIDNIEIKKDLYCMVFEWKLQEVVDKIRREFQLELTHYIEEHTKGMRNRISKLEKRAVYSASEINKLNEIIKTNNKVNEQDVIPNNVVLIKKDTKVKTKKG